MFKDLKRFRVTGSIRVGGQCIGMLGSGVSTLHLGDEGARRKRRINECICRYLLVSDEVDKSKVLKCGNSVCAKCVEARVRKMSKVVFAKYQNTLRRRRRNTCSYSCSVSLCKLGYPRSLCVSLGVLISVANRVKNTDPASSTTTVVPAAAK